MGTMDLTSAAATTKKWTLRLAIGGLVLFVVGSGLYTGATLSYSYSKGERVGFVQKISQRGWACKTWEGDLSQVQVVGQPAEQFQFSVRDDKVAKAIEALAGHKVALHYEQHRGVPSTCFGDTEYFVVRVEKAD
jgi:hypothetical protein